MQMKVQCKVVALNWLWWLDSNRIVSDGEKVKHNLHKQNKVESRGALCGSLV